MLFRLCERWTQANMCVPRLFGVHPDRRQKRAGEVAASVDAEGGPHVGEGHVRGGGRWLLWPRVELGQPGARVLGSHRTVSRALLSGGQDECASSAGVQQRSDLDLGRVDHLGELAPLGLVRVLPPPAGLLGEGGVVAFSSSLTYRWSRRETAASMGAGVR